MSTSLTAATSIWAGGGDGSSWEDADNWSTPSAPTAVDHVRVEGSATVTINDPGAVANSLRIKDNSQLTIMAGADLTVEGNNDKTGAVRMATDALLHNMGSLYITFSTEEYLQMNGRAEIINDGLIHINVSNDEDVDAFEMNNRSQLVNNSVLLIDNSDSDGMNMNNRSSVSNYGEVVMNNIEDEGINMDDRASFYNYGTYSVDGIYGNDGIDMDDSNTYFENSGNIYINNVKETGEGIEVDDGLLVNLPTGTIEMYGVTGEGIRIEDDAEVINDGIIHIQMEDDEFGSSNNGIEIECNATLINYNLITVTINTGEGDDYSIDLECDGALLRNEECGKILLYSEHPILIDNSGAEFINNGYLLSVFSGTHINKGTLENNGKIGAPNGFDIAPNAVTGSGEIGDFPIPTLPCPWELSNVDCEGGAEYNADDEEFIITSVQCNNPISNADDEYAFAQQLLCGDSEIIVQVTDISGSNKGWAGVQMRESSDPGAKMVSLMTNKSSNHRKEVRTSDDATATSQLSSAFNRHWLKIVRSGNNFRGYASSNGFSWFLKFSHTVSMDDCIQVGMVVNSYVSSGEAIGTFSNVSISGGGPAPLQIAPPNTPEVVEVQTTTERDGFTAYPNPTPGTTVLDLSKYLEQKVVLGLVNINGETVQEMKFESIEQSTFELDLSNQVSGVYLIRLQFEDGTEEVQRIILQK